MRRPTKKTGPIGVPAELKPLYEEIVAITDEVSRQHLNDEYGELARKMAAALLRKRPSPLLSGRPRTWAGAILYTLGRVNFLSDKSQKPHMRMDDLCKVSGISQGSAIPKSNEIWDTLGLMQMHPDWTLPSRQDSNLLSWILMVNGLPVDVRDMPREVQEIAYEKGLIPYIPADRQ